MGCVLHIKVIKIGLDHPVIVNAFPILPYSYSDLTSQSPAGWPVAAGTALSGVEVGWGGRSWTLDGKDDTVNLVALPADSRGFDFGISSSARVGIDALGNTAWGGWVWWVVNMSSSDYVMLTSTMTEETMPATTTATAIQIPMTMRPSNSRAKDDSGNALEKAVATGLNAYSNLDKIVEVGKKVFNFFQGASKILPFLGHPTLGGFTGAFAPAPATSRAEEKEDGFEIIPPARPRLHKDMTASVLLEEKVGELREALRAKRA
jgi:hypothetical protein